MSTDPTAPSSPVALLVTSRRQVAAGLAVAGLVLAILCGLWGVWGFARSGASPTAADAKMLPDEPAPKDKVEDGRPKKSPDYQIASVWAGGLALLALISAGWLYTHPPDPSGPMAAARAEILTFGGVVGLLTAVCGIFLGYRWRMSLELWVSGGDRKEAQWVLYAAGVFLAGLLIMFASVQVARVEQRNNAVLRRIMYGFNTVFVGMLLLLLLVVVNIASFVWIPTTLAANDTAFTSLSDESKRVLHGLDKPVTVYLVMPENYTEEIARRPYTSLYADCRVLLSQCEDESKNFHAAYLSPAFDRDRVAALMERYKIPEGDRRVGMLVTVGDEDEHSFIPAAELIDIEGRQLVFQGENRLMSELLYLTDPGRKDKVFFTTGHEELSIEGGGEGPSAGNVVRYLRERKVTVESVRLSPTEARIPDDATVLVIAGPRVAFDTASASAVRDFLRRPVRPGKLIAFLPAFPLASNKVAPTGLEAVLRDLGVEVEVDHKLVMPPEALATQDANGREVAVPPTFVLVGPARIQIEPLARAVGNGRMFMENTRPVRPAPAGPPGGPSRASPLLRTLVPTWEEDSFTADLVKVFEQLRNDREGKFQAEKRLHDTAVPVAVAVTDPAPPGGKGDPKPRAVVFGSDSVLQDRPAINVGREEFRQQLVSDLVDWLRERDASIGIKPRKVGTFALEKPIDWPAQAVLLALVTMGITVLGVGVWLSRRR